jgi:hypothetical protein
VKLSKTEMLEAVGKIYQLASEGKSEREISDEIGLDVETVGALYRQMVDMKSDEIKNKPIEHTYVEYMLKQLRNICDLNEVIEKLKDTKQYNQAMISAIRTRADIWDKLIAKGQECSVIKKAPERQEIGVAMMVAELSNSDLRREVKTAITKMTDMIERHGETDFMKLPVPEVLHSGPKLKEDEAKKSKDGKETKKKKKKKMSKSKGKTSKVSKGRLRKLPPSPLTKGKDDE